MAYFTSDHYIEDDGSFDLYEKLEKYYKNNRLYDTDGLHPEVRRDWDVHIKPYLTPCHEICEFYPANVLSGDASKIKIITQNPDVEKNIRKVWNWSNFSAQKLVIIRQLAIFGDTFIRVCNSDKKIYFEYINPKHVTDFTSDQRGYLKTIRIDYEIEKDEKEFWHTEYVNKEDNYWGIWEHQKGRLASLETLGDPIYFDSLSNFGIDFLPFVHIMNGGFGYKRGQSVFFHSLDKIDELNKQYYALLDLCVKFGEPLFIATSDQLKDGKYLPPVSINGKKTETAHDFLKRYRVAYVPGGMKFESQVPNLQYADLLAVINRLYLSIDNGQPELRYAAIQSSDLSGRAIRLLLSPAIAKGEEMRGGVIAGLKRLNAMALTLGIQQKIFPNLTGLSFEHGDFEHDLISPDLFPRTIDEIAEILHNLVPNGVALATGLDLLGYDDTYIQKAMDAKAYEESLAANAYPNVLASQAQTKLDQSAYNAQ